MIKTVIVTLCVCALVVGSFVGGFAVGYYCITYPIFSALGNVFNTSGYQSNETLVLMKDTKGVILRHFSSPEELIKFVEGFK